MKRNLFFMAAAMSICQIVHAQQSSDVASFSGLHTVQNNNPLNHAVVFNDSSYTGEYYLQKSKNQKTAAWTMLGGGIALSIVGIVGFSANYDIFVENGAADTYAFITLVGTGLSLGSIPLFIASGRNHKKAANLSFKSQHIYIPQQGSVGFKSQPSVSLIFSL